MEGSERRESDDQSRLRLSPSYLKRCVCARTCECMRVSRVRRQLLMTIWRRVEKNKWERR